jgi:type I restriction enzyme S subunit
MASRGDINITEVQPILRNEWLKIKIDETIEKSGAFTKLKSKDYFDQGKYPVVDQGDKFISGYINDKSLLYQGDLPVIIFGDHTRNVKFIDFPFAAGADGTKILKPKSFYNPKFYHYYFKSLSVPDLGYSRHFSILKEIEFPLPPLPEQQRIVAKLDTLFAQLETIKTSMANIPLLLKDFRQQVLTQAVTGKLTEEWRKGKELDIDYLNTVNKFHDSKIKPVKVRGQKGFEIKSFFDTPKTWNWIPVFKLVKDGGNSICAGPFGTIFKAKDFRNEGIPIIFLRHVKKEGFNQRKPLYMDKKVWTKFHQEYSVFGGELLVTKLGDPPGEATIFPNDFGVAMVTPDIMKADFNEDIFKTKFAMYFFNSSIAKDIIAEVSFGMTRLRIDLTMFKSMPIPVPTLKEQKEIVRRVESLFAKADSIEQQYKSLKNKIDTLPQAMLHKAFKGELTEQLDSDGDARELLQQIMELKNSAVKPKKATAKKVKNYPEGSELLGMVAEDLKIQL